MSNTANKLFDYAELHCTSNFSFLRGASHPEELVAAAHALGYRALAITDECSMAGVVRAHSKAKELGFKIIVGSEFTLQDGFRFLLLATDRVSYGRLCRLITKGRRNAEKGSYCLTRDDVEALLPAGCVAIWLPDKTSRAEDGSWLSDLFPKRVWLGVIRLLRAGENSLLKHIERLAQECNLPRVACGDVHMHCRERRALQDTLTAIRLGKPLDELGFELFSNGERHLRTLEYLQKLYPQELLEETIKIADLCSFSLNELHYEYPKELVPEGYTATTWLREITEKGRDKRWPNGAPDSVNKQIEHELSLIASLKYEPYFLTVYDVVRFARSKNILCQGRGSAANSTVCYCLGITEVNPEKTGLLFERFISRERKEPPDIDVDFEHQRREEVIQYIYRRYGRHRTALAATVVTYKLRSAIRDVGKALGMSLEQVDRLAKSIQWWDGKQELKTLFAQSGFDLRNPRIRRLIQLVMQITGFPRHLSQHVGGFVISEGLLEQLVPIENASMIDRTIIQWEKDDLEALGLLKVDVLALGMLTAIRKCFKLIEDYSGERLTMATVSSEDKNVYDMIQKADTIGVFQIESRAQMSMLPRLRPQNYYDLVIEIAIVRPGPIQGDMVHPYLRRRNGEEPEEYPKEEMRGVLGRTLGVPIFQEQVMQIAIVAAKFTPDEADQLRRAMAAWKRKGGLEPYREKLVSGMLANGYTKDYAERIFRMMLGFGDYGFPESHSASFALLAYVSSWMKLYHPAAFTCALLNSQPMGFYRPAQLVQDAQRHGVEVRPVDVQHSLHESSLEYLDKALRPRWQTVKPALRLGLHRVKGLSKQGAERIVSARNQGLFKNAQDLSRRAQLNKKDLESLAAANALRSLNAHRYKAYWEISGIENATPILPSPEFRETEAILQKPAEVEDIRDNYNTTGLTLGRHPFALVRDALKAKGIIQAKELASVANNSIAKVAGVILNRQRPQTASGVVFMTLEDETGHTNVVVWPKVMAAQRKVLLGSEFLLITGQVQQKDNVIHLITHKAQSLNHWFTDLQTQSRNFH